MADRGLRVEEVLGLWPLDQGRLVAGRGGLDKRIRWVSVMEGAAEGFVAPNEFVLTMGAGYEEAGFVRFATQIIDAEPSGLCVCVGKGGPLEAVPAEIVDLCNELDIPVIELPWEVRFADVLRAIAEKLLVGTPGEAVGSDFMPTSLTGALLGRESLNALTEAVETMMGRAVVVLDTELAPLCLGPRAQAVLDPTELAARAADMAPSARQQLRDELEADNVAALALIEPLGLRASMATTARAHDRCLGYVIAVGDHHRASRFDADRRALQHAGVAVAIELLRRQAVAEAEARVHGDFLWELGSSELGPQEVAAKAVLLGYSLNARYQMLVGQVEQPEDSALLDRVVREVQRRGAVAGLHATRRGEEVMVLVPENAPAVLAPLNLIKRLATELPNHSVTWGITDRTVGLRNLAEGLTHVRRTAEVGRALHGPGAISDARALEPFLILSSLSRDPEAVQIAAATLEPLVQYDKNHAGHLIQTLETYLEELGNTSSAARRLYLNRHSLIYRLRKIEELSGRDLDRAEDRLILDLTLRVRRIAREPSGDEADD